MRPIRFFAFIGRKMLPIQQKKYPHAKVFKVEPDDSEFKLNVIPYEV
ncbi:hypothetical protein AQPE_1475 [Aquipluma nitroreducens]|uniref:Uncharacterized protein n=1 Tax=Aquipluma nitroreducens TaxID=2010828 RepID=A0A5K7S704_9BACT|nr:hypothetical protein AQPE_1475 [Aquipluma nitroreducens]